MLKVIKSLYKKIFFVNKKVVFSVGSSGRLGNEKKPNPIKNI